MHVCDRCSSLTWVWWPLMWRLMMAKVCISQPPSTCIFPLYLSSALSPSCVPSFLSLFLSVPFVFWCRCLGWGGGGGAVSVQAIMIPWCLRLIRVCHLCLCAGTIIISSEEGETEGMPLFFVVCLSVAFAYDCLSDFVVKASVERNLACFTWKGTLEIC